MGLLPVVFAELARPVAPLAFAVDASGGEEAEDIGGDHGGFGVVVTAATPTEVQNEFSKAERRGARLRMNRGRVDLESWDEALAAVGLGTTQSMQSGEVCGEETDEEEPEAEDEQFVLLRPDPALDTAARSSRKDRLRRSRERRSREGRPLRGMVRCECDGPCGGSHEPGKPRLLCIGPALGSLVKLGKERGWRVVWRDAAEARDDMCLMNGCYDPWIGRAGGGTWSRARRPAVRSEQRPWGSRSRKQVEKENMEMQRMRAQWKAARRGGVFATLEGPECSWMWNVLREEDGDGDLEEVMLDRCRFGSRYQQRTRLLVNHGLLGGLARQCVCAGPHAMLRGRVWSNEHGWLARTAIEVEWPERLARECMQYLDRGVRHFKGGQGASVLAKALRRYEEEDDLVEVFEDRKGRVVRRKVAMQKAPLEEDFGVHRRRHWCDVTWGRFKHGQHINLGEADALLKAVRAASKRQPMHHHRLLIFSDSQVVVGSCSKGRSSSKVLLHKVRRLSALCLACRITLGLRWIKSAENAADEPSRRLKQPAS